MKPMSVLLCGIVVSTLAAPTLAQQQPQGWNWRPDRPATIEAWQQSQTRARDFQPPQPRGDLRGDIASNVRGRDAPRNERARR